MCPACAKPMVAFQYQGVEIDRCLDCAGTWLDAGELETMIELAGGATGRVSAALNRTVGDRKTNRRCPRCPRKLREFEIAPVHLDRCPHAHGLWFDHGEMAQLIHHFHDGEEGEVAHFFMDLFRNEFSKTD